MMVSCSIDDDDSVCVAYVCVACVCAACVCVTCVCLFV